MNRITKYFFGFATAILTGLAVAFVFQLNLTAKESLPAPKLNVAITPVSRQPGVNSFSSVLKKASPSVVTIFSTRVIRAQDNPFYRFNGNDPRFRRQIPDFQSEGLGSGVIVSSDGYILTASHVVEGADDVRVALADGAKEIRVKVVGEDAASDVAVLKVDAKDLPAITLADSDKIEVGDVALAIGNPFGVGQTVTMGIISGLGRSGVGINGNNGYENFIQTDAAVNPGNSGGALVDADGRLIGINTAIFSQSGGNEGIGFAVPINLARNMMEQILKDGKVTRGYLGVKDMQSITPELAKEFNIPAHGGVLIGTVMPGTPAEKAGIKELDAIVEFNGKKVADTRQFRLTVAEVAPQTTVTLKIVRDGKEKSVTAKLGELPDNSQASNSKSIPSNSTVASSDPLQGVTIVDLTPRLRRQFGSQVQGPVVTAVDSDSSAAEAGLAAGDVIIEVNHKTVTTAAQVAELAGKSTNGRMLLRVLSHDEDGSSAKRFILIQT